MSQIRSMKAFEIVGPSQNLESVIRPVLLVFFGEAPAKALAGLVQKVKEEMERIRRGPVDVLGIESLYHPEVVRSFNVTIFPAFVLVEQGMERWRYEGMLNPEQLETALATPS